MIPVLCTGMGPSQGHAPSMRPHNPVTGAWSPHGFPKFVGTILFATHEVFMRPHRCPHACKLYKGKVRLKRRSLAAIRLYSVPFPNLIRESSFELDLEGDEGRFQGIHLEASSNEESK